MGLAKDASAAALLAGISQNDTERLGLHHGSSFDPPRTTGAGMEAMAELADLLERGFSPVSNEYGTRRYTLWVEALRGQMTVVLTTHYLEEAEALSDRVGIMAHGRLKALGTARELVERTGAKDFEDAFVALAASEEVVK